ncbi:MAG: hypothetical protein J6Y93_03275 [Treponema sp.]|nr:hypothetical protein [Treponema sp.]
MKKSVLFTLFSAVLFATVSFAAAADDAEQEKQQKEYKYEYVESPMSYRQVNVYKILDQKDSYIVMHSKGHREVGNVAIPKKWYKENPARLRFRALPKGMSSYMTVFYKDGKFDYVILTVPTSRMDPVWGIADAGVSVNTDKDTLDIVY